MREVLIVILWAMLALGAAGCVQENQPPINNLKTDDLSKRRVEDPLISRFTDSDWNKVYRAAFALERQPKIAIPLLIQLLARDEHVKLQNTADLIYPGAETFYGHGWSMDYDIDWLPVRAGWCLEQITFQDFGFSERNFFEHNVRPVVIAGNGDLSHDAIVKIESDASLRKIHRSKAIARAKAWWQASQKNWNRLSALSEALRSKKSDSVNQAMEWMRNGEIPIEGFTRELYINTFFTDRKSGTASK